MSDRLKESIKVRMANGPEITSVCELKLWCHLQVVTPRRVGDVYTYDTPRSLTHTQQAAQFDYDVPPTKHSPHDSGMLL